MDSVEHDVMVTSGPASFRSPMLSQGESWSHTFTTAGTYSYICSVHPDMRGSVTAKAKAAPPPSSAPAQPTRTPAPAVTPTAEDHHSETTDYPSQGAAAPKRKSSTHAGASPAAAPATTQLAPVAQQEGETLNPLLLVLGLSVAVVVFCLLLMVSRPAVQPSTQGTQDS